jgi:hypothetical protein
MEVPPFYAQEIPIYEGARMEIIWEHLGIWSPPGTSGHKQPGEANQLANLVVSAWALLTGQALVWSLGGWIEATEATFEGTVMGYRPEHFRDPGVPREKSMVSKRIRRAAELAILLRSNQQYRLALRDIHTAEREESDDALFFAYRAIENAARAIAGVTGDLGKAGWAGFHEARSRTPADGQAQMRPLTDARDAAAHGQEESSTQSERDELILLARQLIADTIQKDCTIPAKVVKVSARQQRFTS